MFCRECLLEQSKLYGYGTERVLDLMGKGPCRLAKIHQALLLCNGLPISTVVPVNGEYQQEKTHQGHAGDNAYNHNDHYPVVIVLPIKVEIQNIREVEGSWKQPILGKGKLASVQEDGKTAESDIFYHPRLPIEGCSSRI